MWFLSMSCYETQYHGEAMAKYKTVSDFPAPLALSEGKNLVATAKFSSKLHCLDHSGASPHKIYWADSIRRLWRRTALLYTG